MNIILTKILKQICRSLPKCRLKTNLKNKLNNNRFMLIKNGKTILNPKIKGLSVEFTSENGIVILHYPIKKIQNLKIVCGKNSKIEIMDTKKYYIDTTISATSENCVKTIGRDTSMNRGCSVICDFEPNRSITIGDECMFAPEVWMRTSDGHGVYSTLTKERLNKSDNIKIGNHVWVLSRCFIAKGAELGDNLIVATNSVVTKKFNTENAMIGGIPAKLIKSDVAWSRKIFDRMPEDIPNAVSV